jgi:hypothetical protein
MNKTNLFWQVYLNLESEVLELSKYIFFTDTNSHQLETYSAHIADLLVRVCVEIEAISKELYFDNGGTKPRGSNDIYFDEDCLELLNNLCKTDSKVVKVVATNFQLEKDENKVLTPLKNAHKRSKVLWVKAYQAVKHDRYNSLHYGNVKALLQSMGALFLLNIYYRDIKLTIKYLELHNLDMGFGSKIFTLEVPRDDNIIAVINGEEFNNRILESTTSPYIAKYTDSCYKQIVEARKKYLDKINAYWILQPEIKEPAFIQQMLEAGEREKKNPQSRVISFWELCQYRLNKKVPNHLPFEKRKRLLVQTSEWKGQIRQMNKHLKENELTPENIQAEINHAGVLAGIELDRLLRNDFDRKSFVDAYCEIVLDKGNVRYSI